MRSIYLCVLELYTGLYIFIHRHPDHDPPPTLMMEPVTSPPSFTAVHYTGPGSITSPLPSTTLNGTISDPNQVKTTIIIPVLHFYYNHNMFHNKLLNSRFYVSSSMVSSWFSLVDFMSLGSNVIYGGGSSLESA